MVDRLIRVKHLPGVVTLRLLSCAGSVCRGSVELERPEQKLQGQHCRARVGHAQMSRRAAVSALLLAAGLLSAGCSQSAEQAGTGAGKAAVPAAPAAEDAAALAMLERVGAKVARDNAGYVIDVDLRKTTATDADLPALTPLTRLRALHLDELPITDAGIAALESFTGPLAALDLRNCSLTDAAMSSLAKIRTLRAIRLSGDSGATSVADDGIARLASLTSLKVLAADGLWVSTAGLQALLPLQGLEELYLKSTLVDDDSLAVIAQFPALKKLRISKTQVSSAGLQHLTACRQLQELDLSENSLLDNDSLQYVGAMTSLKKLNLWRVAVSDPGIAQLAPLTSMEWLNLDNTQLSDAGLPALQGMQRLTFLHLGSTSVSDAGLPLLKQLTALQDLKVTRTAVTDGGVAELQKSLPNTAIQIKYIEGE